jgi:hypothetical protein
MIQRSRPHPVGGGGKHAQQPALFFALHVSDNVLLCRPLSEAVVVVAAHILKRSQREPAHERIARVYDDWQITPFLLLSVPTTSPY